MQVKGWCYKGGGSSVNVTAIPTAILWPSHRNPGLQVLPFCERRHLRSPHGEGKRALRVNLGLTGNRQSAGAARGEQARWDSVCLGRLLLLARPSAHHHFSLQDPVAERVGLSQQLQQVLISALVLTSETVLARRLCFEPHFPFL